jgi:hypothetical protein
MNLDSLNKWLTLVANIGVLAGILFLAFELQQNTQMMRAQMNQSRADTALAEQHSIYTNDIIAPILVKAEANEQLNPVEMRMYRTYFRGFNRNQDNNLWQYRNGFLGENIPRSIRGAVRSVIGGNKLGLQLWDQSNLDYTDDYREFVEEAIADLR